MPARYRAAFLGITKAGKMTPSVIGAAAFRETQHVLAHAAIRGACDELLGLMESVAIGGLIPAGTGLYRHAVPEFIVE